MRNTTIARVALWLLLMLIPLITMGWTIGRTGLSSDDWSNLERLSRGDYSAGDNTRPLSISNQIIYILTGGNIQEIQIVNILIIGICAVCFFEVSRLYLNEWQPRLSTYVAFLVALIYVLNPVDVSRYWLVIIHHSFMHLYLLLVALMWFLAGKYEKPQWVIAASVVALLMLLHKETSLFSLLFFPSILAYFGQKFISRRWTISLLFWYGIIAVYMFWRFVLISDEGGFADLRVVSGIPPISRSVFFMGSTAFNFLINVHRVAITEDLATLVERYDISAQIMLFISIVVSCIVVSAAYLVTRKNSSNVPLDLSGKGFRKLIGIWLFSLVFTLAAAFPFLFRGNAELSIIGVNSRDTSLSTLGISLFVPLTCLVAVHISVRRRWFDKRNELKERSERRLSQYGLITASLAAIVFLNTSFIRQFRTGGDYIIAWDKQKVFWQEIDALNLSLPENSLVGFYDFPRQVGNAKVVTDSCFYLRSLNILFDNVPTTLVALPVEYESTNWRIENNILSVELYGNTFHIPIENVVILEYIENDGSVQILDSLPEEVFTQSLSLNHLNRNPTYSTSALRLNERGRQLLDLGDS